ncbi:uncharacterized protein LOC144452740 [Glandiceps talaboti]
MIQLSAIRERQNKSAPTRSMNYLLITVIIAIAINSVTSLDCYVCSDGLYGPVDTHEICRFNFKDHSEYKQDCDDLRDIDFKNPRCHEAWSRTFDGEVDVFVRGCIEATDCHDDCKMGTHDNQMCSYCCDDDYCNDGMAVGSAHSPTTHLVTYLICSVIIGFIYHT